MKRLGYNDQLVPKLEQQFYCIEKNHKINDGNRRQIFVSGRNYYLPFVLIFFFTVMDISRFFSSSPITYTQPSFFR